MSGHLPTRRCRILGHKWRPTPIRYEQGRTMAKVGGLAKSVPVTWVIDEVCVTDAGANRGGLRDKR